MATLKACVQKKRKDGMYVVYIRVTQLRKIAYIKTTWLVSDRGIGKKGDIIDPYVIQQTSKLIETYYNSLNKTDTTNWSIEDVVKFMETGTEDVSFSEYAHSFIDEMEKEGRFRTAKNYKLALKSIEFYAGSDNVMFSRMTYSFLTRWIDSMKNSARKKQQYPICIREIWKSAQRRYNDEERGIIRIASPWIKIQIPKSDESEKRAIPANLLRKFFQVIPDDSRFKHPLMELGQDVAKISFCMCGLNTIDMYDAKKEQYKDGIFSYNRAKTRSSRTDKAYFEIKVPNFLLPTFEKYLSKNPKSPWLFDFHERLRTADSFNANVNIGVHQICDSVEGLDANFGAFRHSWATIAQNDCGATLGEVDFGMNHSTNKMARVYTKIDFSPAWKLNEKVIEFIFFSNEDSRAHIQKEASFEKISKYNLVKGEAFLAGNIVATVEDTGYSNVEQVIDSLEKLLPGDIPDRMKIQIKITNVDKKVSQLYEHVIYK